MIVDPSNRIPLKLWLDTLEEGALQQAKNAADFPFAFHHVAIMADAHSGYGVPIGCVLATKDVVIPNAVGVDIGCGVCAVKTSSAEIGREGLIAIMRKIRASVPLGFEHHAIRQADGIFDDAPDLPIVMQELDNARRQLGTLGGGNHFIELQRDREGFMWIMVHSGSRNFGLKIANEYHKRAKDACERKRVELPDLDLAYLPAGSSDFKEYMAAMHFACAFAARNRRAMVRAIENAVLETAPEARFEEPLDISRTTYVAAES